MKVAVGCHVTTKHGLAAIEEAARQCGTSGTLVLVGFAQPSVGEEAERAHDAEVVRVTELCESTADRIRTERGIEVVVEVPRGTSKPSDAILRAAGLHEVDLIVVGLRQRSRVGKLLLGSSAQDVLLGAEANVLAVTSKEGAGEN